MNCSYGDITSRLGEPLWWNEHAVPRYVPFSPHETADIYADECALVEIACQGCGKVYRVAFSENKYQRLTKDADGKPALSPPMSEQVQRLHFGDPPNTGCCAAGATMNSIPLRVVEFWQRGYPEPARRADLEVEIECDWWDGPRPAFQERAA